MSTTAVPPSKFRRPAVFAFAVLLGLAPLRDPQDAGQDASQDAAAAGGAPAAAATDDPPAFTTEQLEQMLAPIALYPDDLLSQILMASTYPLEIVQADRWVKAHTDLKGDAAAKALEAEDWDPSVKSLVAVPDLLALLSDKLDWTQQLGDAFIGQPEQVMSTVQTLRGRAKDNGKLESSKDQNVTVEQEGDTQVIVIESAEPDVIYVPVYDTTVVYGGWPYPAYPPYPYYPPAWHYGAAIAIGFAWGYAWGDCDWHGGDVDIDVDQNFNRNTNIDRDRYRGEGGLDRGKGKWKHDPGHRGNQPYRDAKTAQQFGGRSTRDATASREAFRGRSGGASVARVIRGGPEGGARAGESKSNWIDSSRASEGRSDTRTSGRTDSRANTGSRTGTRSGALDGVDRGGSQVRRESKRGSASRSRASASRAGAMRGGRGGGGRGGRR